MARRNPIPPKTISEFNRTHFPSLPMARPFHSWIMLHKVISSYFVDLDYFNQLLVCSSSVKKLLEQVGLDNVLSILILSKCFIRTRRYLLVDKIGLLHM